MVDPEVILSVDPEIVITPQNTQPSTDSKSELRRQIYEKYDLYAKTWFMLWLLSFVPLGIGIQSIDVDSTEFVIVFSIVFGVIMFAILIIGLWIVGHRRDKELGANQIFYIF